MRIKKIFIPDEGRPAKGLFCKHINALTIPRVIPDCYDCRMNLSTPIIICDENEEIRLLLKEMLTRHGYFHLVEASSSEEVLQLIMNQQFILIHKNLINEKIKSILSHWEKFLIIAQADSAETVNLSANFGVKHLISFPYTSKSLVEKINELLA